jgi:hypothetical protein
MTSYIFFNININKLDEYSDATIYHSANNWTIPILFKNCDFYINYEDIQYRFYYINTNDNIQFKIKNKDTYILLNDSKFLTFNDNGNINNIIITTEENNLYNGINHINIKNIQILKNEFIKFEGEIIDYNFNGKGIEFYKACENAGKGGFNKSTEVPECLRDYIGLDKSNHKSRPMVTKLLNQKFSDYNLINIEKDDNGKETKIITLDKATANKLKRTEGTKIRARDIQTFIAQFYKEQIIIS